MTGEEAVSIILTKLIDRSQDVETYNGFPKEFNHNSRNDNTTQITSNGYYWFPFVDNGSVSYDSLLDVVVKDFTFDLTKGRLLFHGTSFEGAMSINNEIEVTQCQTATDFGMKNFYVTDTFYTAGSWANRSNQPAIVIFFVPNELFNTDNKLVFNSVVNLEEWKETVFKARNPPSPFYHQETSIYKKYVKELDDKEYIEGPIFSNSRTGRLSSVEYLKYQYKGNTIIPNQISFKEKTVRQLKSCIMTTLCYKDKA